MDRQKVAHYSAIAVAVFMGVSYLADQLVYLIQLAVPARL